MKKILSIALILMLVAGSALAASDNITVLTREDGSGTLAAFTELFGIEDIVPEAIVTNSTAVMLTTVAGNPDAIGYISLGSLNDTVKALEINGVYPSVETILSGEYTVARPFNIATKEGLSEVAQDFVNFILSPAGQAVVLAKGYVPVIVEEKTEETAEETTETTETTEEPQVPAYESTQPAGSVVVAGSSSVTPVMEKLKEAYALVNPNATVEVQQSDSSTGMKLLADGVCDIGMASRALKASELEKGLIPTVIAMDGIAIVVNVENALTGVTSEQVTAVFTGEITTWSELTAE